jgi:acyl-CoA thioesterase
MAAHGQERSADNTPRGDMIADSQVEQDATRPGAYRAHITDAWKTRSAFGGMLMTVALRASQRAIAAREMKLLYVSAVFSRPVPCGPVAIDVELLGKTAAAAQTAAHVRAGGDSGVGALVHACFGAERVMPERLLEAKFPEGVRGVDESMPNAAAIVAGLPVLMQSATRWGHEFRGRPGAPPAEVRACGAEPAQVSAWIRYHVPPLDEGGLLDPLCLPVFTDVIAPALFRGLGPDVPVFPVTLSLDLHVVGSSRSEWLLQHMRIVHFAGGFACATVELWDETRQLIAVSSQRRLCKPLATGGG